MQEHSRVFTEQPEASNTVGHVPSSIKTPHLETSPSMEESKAPQTAVGSRNSLNVPYLQQANYGRDSNVYKSLEQRLVRN
jgi:hypothetical protein